jgi:protein CpxP
MKLKLPLLASVAALTIAAGAATLSFAQEPPPPGAAPPPAGDHAQWAEHRREHQEARAHALHDILNIRADQEAAFQAFIASMAPPSRAGGMGEHGDHDVAHLTTPQRLDRMAAKMAEHQARFQQRADAIRHFYAALSPEQQRAFDALHEGMMGGHHGHDHGGPGGPGGPGHAEGPQG